MEMPEIKGDGLDMAQLMEIFASKMPPDNTINRIEELEKQMADALGKTDKIDDLLRRVKALETRAYKTYKKLDAADITLRDHETRIKALEEAVKAL